MGKYRYTQYGKEPVYDSPRRNGLDPITVILLVVVVIAILYALSAMGSDLIVWFAQTIKGMSQYLNFLQ